MRRLTLASSTVLGIVIGATVFHGASAVAQTAMIDLAPITQQDRPFAQETGVGMQTPSVPLTTIRTQFPQNMGLPAQTNGSWLQALQIEAERRISDPTWNANLHDMAPASVQREIASGMAMNNYLMFQTYKMQTMLASINGARLVENTQRRLHRHPHGIRDRQRQRLLHPGQRTVATRIPTVQRSLRQPIGAPSHA